MIAWVKKLLQFKSVHNLMFCCECILCVKIFIVNLDCQIILTIIFSWSTVYSGDLGYSTWDQFVYSDIVSSVSG